MRLLMIFDKTFDRLSAIICFPHFVFKAVVRRLDLFCEPLIIDRISAVNDQ